VELDDEENGGRVTSEDVQYPRCVHISLPQQVRAYSFVSQIRVAMEGRKDVAILRVIE